MRPVTRFAWSMRAKASSTSCTIGGLATRPALDLDELARGTDPPALIARKILVLRRHDGDADRRALLEGARQRLELLSGRRSFAAYKFAPPTDEDLLELLERAALGALDELLAQRRHPA